MEWMLMPLKRYAQFSGRSRRMEYWMFFLFQILIGIGFWILMAAVGGTALMTGDVNGAMAAGGVMMVIGLAYAVVSIGMLIPSIAVGVRRLHDTNRSGWWLLAPLVGYAIMFAGTGMVAASPDSPGTGGVLALVGGLVVLVMAVVLFVFMLLEGTRGPNRFGEDPKAPAHSEVFA